MCNQTQTPEATITIRRLTLGLERMRQSAFRPWEDSTLGNDLDYHAGRLHALEEVIAPLEELK